MNIAIVLSGGVGLRVHADIPKQYLRIGGKMLITYSLETLLQASEMDAVLVVADPDWQDRILEDVQEQGLDTSKIMDFALPGKNRQESILHALQSMMAQRNKAISENTKSAGKSEEVDTVLIHDAARPNLTRKQIAECLSALEEHDGVMPYLPMKDTVYFSDDGIRISKLLDRSRVFAGQAPEVFRFAKYYQANMDLLPDRLYEINGSTEPAILAGMDIVMIPGDDKNFKVTTDADLERFKKMMEKD